jgi:hypothetical protein
LPKYSIGRFTSQLIISDGLATYPPDPLPLIREGGSVSKRGAKPPSKTSSPSPLKERGIKGVRLIK